MVEERDEYLAILRGLKPICSNLKENALANLLEIGKIKNFIPGQSVTLQENKPYVYVILKGTALVGHLSGDTPFYFARRGAGTLVGEVTAGAANFHYPARLTGHLMAAVPSGYPVDPVSGGNWEGVGVQPDVAVPASDAFGAGYELALAQLRR